MSVNAKAVLKSIETAGLYDEGGHHKTQLTMNVSFVGDNGTAYDGQPQCVIDLEDPLLASVDIQLAIRQAIATFANENYDFNISGSRILAFIPSIL